MKKRSYYWIAAGLGLILGMVEAQEEPRASLNVSDVPLREVLSLLSRQTGVEIALDGGGTLPISANLQDRPLQELLQSLCAVTRCQLVTTAKGYVVRSPDVPSEPASRVAEWFVEPGPGAAQPSPELSPTPLDYSFLEVEGLPDFAFELRLDCNSWPEGGKVRVVFHYHSPEDYDGLLLGPDRVGFVRARGGLVEPLGTAGGFTPPVPGGQIILALTCRGWEMRALINHELRARAFDDSLAGGRLGYHLPTGVTCEEPLFQPVEAPYLTDDFMRAGGAVGEWEPLSGHWLYSGPRNPEADPSRSANPFAYRALGLSAHAMAGHWFWDDYCFEAAVKPTGPGAVGLSFYGRDERNFLLFRWTSPGQGGERQFWLVRDGLPQCVTAAPGGYEPGQWYRLAVRLVGPRGEARIDGRTVLEADLPGFTQGRVGLYSESTQGTFFDDVLVTGARGWYDEVTPSPGGPWQDIEGTWSPTSPTDPQRKGRTKARSHQPVLAATLTGQPTWQNYSVEAEVLAEESDQVGLCFYYAGPDQYLLFRLVPPEGAGTQGRAQLFSVVKALFSSTDGSSPPAGGGELLAETAVPFIPTSWNRLRVEILHHHVRAWLNGRLVGEGFEARQFGGRAGLYAFGSGEVTFRNFRITFPEESDETLNITEQFSREESMAGWTNPEADWRPAPGPQRSLYWHRGDFFGDVRVTLTLPEEGIQIAPTGLILSGDGVGFPSGYILEVRPQGHGWFDLLLWRETQGVAHRKAFLGQTSALHFERKGSFLLVYADDTYLLGFHDPRPLPHRHVGVWAHEQEWGLDVVRVHCSHLYDTVFSQAPVDWRVTHGLWETMSRWRCQPGWTWFGGAYHPTPTIWTKRAFEGDLTLEFWAALRMDRDDAGGYSHPSDINATICGDGRDGADGYHFLFATENNTASQVWRGNTMLAENREAVFDRPNTDGDLNRFHRHWFHVRIERRGQRLRYWVDDALVADVTDPRPLPGGPIALWTRNNGLLVARARVWYERSPTDVN